MAGRPKVSLEQKLDPELVDSLCAMSVDELKSKLATVNAHEQELLKQKEDDEQLQEAKDAYAAAGAVYKDGLKSTKTQRAYINQLLQDKGKV